MRRCAFTLPVIVAVITLLCVALPADAQDYVTNITFAKRQAPGEFFPAGTNDTYAVTGIITSPNFASPVGTSSNIEFYIQDPTVQPPTNAGMMVFIDDSVWNDPDDIPCGFQMGAEISVDFGFIDQRVGVRLINPDLGTLDLSDVNCTPSPITPYTNTIAALLASAEDYEGSLVHLNDVDITDPQDWPGLNAQATMTITDATGEVTFFINRETNLGGQLAPTNAFDLVGIFTQYDTGVVPSNGYEVVARFYTDVIQDVTANSAPNLVLNPSNVAFLGVGEEITIDILGQDRNAADELTFGTTNTVGTLTDTGYRQATFTWPGAGGGTTNDIALTVFDGTTTVTDIVQVIMLPVPTNAWDFEGWKQGWISESVTSSEDWVHIPGAGAESTDNLMYMSGWSADAPSDDWLISPPLDLTVYTAPRLTFWKQFHYTGAPGNLIFQVSTDYSGSGSPLSATWDEFPIPRAAPEEDQVWVEFGMPLADYNAGSAVHVAFRYQSDVPQIPPMHTWRIDQITLGEAAPNQPPVIYPALSDKTVVEGDTVAFPVSAFEPNGDTVTLAMIPASIPNATFVSTSDVYTANGLFSLTPSIGLGGTTVSVSFAASDNVDGAGDTVNVKIAVLPPPTCGLIISEYILGTGNNKAIELYNGTPYELDLEGYRLVRYFNGNTSAGGSISLAGTVPSGGTFLVVDPDASATLVNAADQIAIQWFNGNDALVLRKGSSSTGEVIDSLGRVGENPRVYWGTLPDTTRGNTLVRKSSVLGGDTIIDDPFDPADEFDSLGSDDFSNIQMHTNDCPGAGPWPPIISPTLSDKAVTVGGTLEFDVTANEPDGDAITITEIPPPLDNAMLTSNSNGSSTYTFTPVIGQDGPQVVSFIAEDKDGADTNTIEIVVNAEPSGTGLLIISEIVDGTLPGGQPKFVEFTNTGPTPIDMSGYSVGNFNNGGTTLGGGSSTLLFGTLAGGDSYVFSYEADPGGGSSIFNDVYGFEPDQYAGGGFINGDDVIALFLADGTGPGGAASDDGTDATTVERYGDLGVDGSGKVWEYTDGYSYRLPAVTSPASPFDTNEWFFGGANSLETGNDAEELILLQTLTTPGTHVVVYPDTDGDGIPDWWEQLYFGNITNAVATDDEEPDGPDNLSEYIADTDPTNPLSFFSITEVSVVGTNVVVTFPSSSARNYQPQYTEDIIVPSAWSNLGSVFSGAGVTNDAFTDPADTFREYRLDVSVP